VNGMISNIVYPVKTWTGEEKLVKKIVIYPERDGNGIIFYKIEGQLNTDFFMISYFYDKQTAYETFHKLLDKLVDYQIRYLQEL
jgi:hypothetical protein